MKNVSVQQKATAMDVRDREGCSEMEENKKFDKQAYENGAEVICDACGSTVNYRNTASTRVIAKDKKGFDVTENFFVCQECGKHYTITIIDREMKMMIQKRQQLMKQIRLHEQIRSQERTIRRLITKNDNMKRQQEERSRMLKEKYREECGQ